VIGRAAEEIVYFYASCDRIAVYPQLGKADPVHYRDRFTGREFEPTAEELATFVELTWANALEVVASAPNGDWSDVARFLRQTESLASDAARRSAAELLGLRLESAVAG
jgi:hypothetical protein